MNKFFFWPGASLCLLTQTGRSCDPWPHWAFPLNFPSRTMCWFGTAKLWHMCLGSEHLTTSALCSTTFESVEAKVLSLKCSAKVGTDGTKGTSPSLARFELCLGETCQVSQVSGETTTSGNPSNDNTGTTSGLAQKSTASKAVFGCFWHIALTSPISVPCTVLASLWGGDTTTETDVSASGQEARKPPNGSKTWLVWKRSHWSKWPKWLSLPAKIPSRSGSISLMLNVAVLLTLKAWCVWGMA